MGCVRRGYNLGEYKMKRGVALFSVLITSLIVGIIMAGLYFLISKIFETTRMSGVYVSTRDAARGGINYSVSLITGGTFDSLITGDCPDGTTSTSSYCCRIALNYRLYGTAGEFSNSVIVCLRGYLPQPGYERTAVAETRPTPGGRNFVYSIVSEAFGPQGSKSRVEAVYVR